jgi:hypothetical protein
LPNTSSSPEGIEIVEKMLFIETKNPTFGIWFSESLELECKRVF